MNHFNPEQALSETRREFGKYGGVSPSLSRSSTFTVMEPSTMPQIFEGVKGPEKGGCYLYSRHFNPTVDLLCRYISSIENTEASMCTASGMSAISCALLQILKSGDHIVSSSIIYGGTHALIEKLFTELNISATFVNPTDMKGFEKAITPSTKVLYVESMSNPTLEIPDLKTLSKLAKKNNIKLVVDNTFMPMIITPSKLGADVVIHSLTKYINRASDLLGGVICGSKNFINQLMDIHTGRVMLFGPTMDPRVVFDIIQRLPHLGLRMREHSKWAHTFAKRLEKLKIPVLYPGLTSHKQHKLLKSLSNSEYGFGGIFAIDCKIRKKADILMSILQKREKFGLIAVSLGYFDTLMTCSGSSTSSEIKPEDQKKMGLSPGLLRISIGYTGGMETRLNQLERAVTEVLLLKKGTGSRGGTSYLFLL